MRWTHPRSNEPSAIPHRVSCSNSQVPICEKSERRLSGEQCCYSIRIQGGRFRRVRTGANIISDSIFPPEAILRADPTSTSSDVRMTLLFCKWSLPRHKSLKFSSDFGSNLRFGGDYQNISAAWQFSWLRKSQSDHSSEYL